MPDDKLNTSDKMTAEVGEALQVPERNKYLVTVEGGIFKNGKLYRKGTHVELDANTAAAFMNEDVLGKGNAQIEPLTGDRNA